ncbi:MAG: galactokinase [Bryobacteraceae bacterium]|jgi:galactokinase
MTDTDADRLRRMARLFEEHFGGRAALVARAPGRVDLMGSHTDYNLGFVLTLPISRDTWIAARPRDDRNVCLYTANLDSQSCFPLDRIERAREVPWTNYVRGVAWALQEEGLELRGFDGVIQSTVPVGSGLASSAALECATAVVLQALGGWRLDATRMAQLCLKAECDFVGLNCGILDQFTACAGRDSCALLLDCRDLSSRPVEMSEGLRVVICDTRARHELSGSEYAVRRAQCEEGARQLDVAALRDASLEQLEAKRPELPGDEVYRRCRFIIEENARVLQLAEALSGDDRAAIGRLCAESFRGACELYEIGAPAMLSMMRAMLAAPGVIGARQAGAGFGGCMVAFVEAEAVDEFARAVRTSYGAAMKLPPEIYAVRAAAGAGLIQEA